MSEQEQAELAAEAAEKLADEPVTPEQAEQTLISALADAAVETAEGEVPIIEEVFITGEETLATAEDLLKEVTRKSMRCFDESRIVSDEATSRGSSALSFLLAGKDEKEKELTQKTARGTQQSVRELGRGSVGTDMATIKIVEPPYPPELLAAFLEVDETHFRCVRTKVTDAVGREFELVPTVTVDPEEKEEKAGRPKTQTPEPRPPLGSLADPTRILNQPGPGVNQGPGEALDDNRTLVEKIAKGSLSAVSNIKSDHLPKRTVVPQSEVDAETQDVEDFIEDANEVLGFEGVLDRACMDYEAVGWAAIEIIRSADFKVRRIAHVPAPRVRVLKGWAGFVEIFDNTGLKGSVAGAHFRYYQPFGSKVVMRAEDPVTGEKVAYNPKDHGELDPAKVEWNLVDRETGKPTNDISRAANEILWIPRHHANTIYYGFTDVVPALGWLLANVHIRDYLLSFFEHNTVPRFAVIIEGAKLSEPVKKAIMSYFGTHVKGKAHKTLIVPIPALRGEVKVRFEKLDADNKEGSFQDTKKNNSQGIMTAHGVSPAIIGIAESSELGSGKGLSQAEIYKDRIVTPSQRYWARKLNRMFRLGLGTTLVAIKFNPLDIRDRKAEQEVLTGYLKTGVATINEVRKRAGLGKPIEGGDRAFVIVGNQIMFVDELTEAMGSEMEALTDELERTQSDMANKAAEDKGRMAGERQAAATNGNPPGMSNGNPSTPNKANGKQPAAAKAGSQT